MANLNRYFSEARGQVNERYSNMNGSFVDDANFAGDDFFQANGQGAGMSASAPTSQPYIVNVTSVGTAAVPNFAVLGSYEFINNAGFTAGGDLVVGDVTISSGISGITYREMLYQFMQNPFTVGLTYLQSATANQVLETLAINTRDANGNEAQKTLVPTIDPYQQQSNIVAMRYGFRIDGFTKVVISSVLAGATVKLYFYPSDNINLARGLSGRSVSEAFGNPGIVKAQEIRLKG